MSLMLREFERAPVPVLCADAFIAYLAAQHIGRVWPWGWFGFGALLQLYRFFRARSLIKTPPDSAAAALRNLTAIFALIGLTKAAILPLFFFSPFGIDDSAFLVTMVITGMTAGGVASAAGMMTALIVWGAPLFLVLIVGWLWHGGVSGIAVALLLTLLFAILLAYVRDHRKMIEELVRLVDEKESLSASLQQARDRAELTSEAKTRFFAAASHDLRQPLHALSINASTLGLISRRSSDDVLRDVSRGINSALSQSQSLLDGLLDISRLDAHAVEVRPVAIDMVTFAQGLQAEYTALAAQKGLRFSLQADSNPVFAMTDPDQLARIVGNLVGNAIKFTANGTVALVVARGDGTAILRVCDTGRGIPTEEQSKVFEEFYQSRDTSRDRARGLGLGLAIVKRTCELLAVELSFSSEPSVGTTFELRIPLALAPPRIHAQPGPTIHREEVCSRSYSALVVDDETLVLDSVKRYLMTMGWSVRCGSSGRDAQEAIEDGFTPDVLVVDYRLHNESGLDVIARMRQRLPSLPAVIITGDTAPQRLQELALQASDVLHKPVDGARLANALLKAIGAPILRSPQ
jgi:signal transduction histidine kinase/ActR/RegA family two-component response regulator